MRLDKRCNILECLIIIILFELCKDIECQSHPGYTMQVNTSIIVQERCCVTIPCTFSAANKKVFTNSKGYWKNLKNNDIVAATKNSNQKGTKSNFHITGDTDQGDCTLTITDAKKEDSGTYFFRFERLILYSYTVKTITVNVTDPPKKPEVDITSDDENKERKWDLLIGIVCGMAIAIFIILASKLIARKFFKMNIYLCVHMKYDATDVPPEEDKVEENLEEMYMNVDKPKPITKTSDDATEQRGSISNPNDQEEIPYSNIVFSSQPTRILPMQPEAEYATIVKKV